MKTLRIMLAIFMVMGISVFTNAQSLVVSGKVVDENNQAIAGVFINVKGSSTTTITDMQGDYKISAKMGKTLVFSYIGYEKRKVTVTGARIDVKLTPEIITLNETVVVGYGMQGKTSGLASTKIRGAFAMHHYPLIRYNAVENEEYGTYRENRFISVANEALSTFSLDVDAASYGNVRRMINQGQMPEKDAVRIEEMINYFSYGYARPTGEHPVNIVTESAVCPWNTKHKLVRIGVKAKEIASENLPASNFVFLIDVSGSMQGANRLELVKASLKLLTNNLREKDRVSIVVYAGAAGEILPSTPGNDRQKIKEAIDNLSAGGSTAGGAGIRLAYKIAEKNFIKNGNNRIILCTDGDFNVGISSNAELESLIESKRKTGVYLTVLGYGMGNYKDNKLQTLAEKGNGNHAYIDNIQEANKVLVSEFGSTMYTVAKDVKLQIEFNPAYVNAYRLIGYESRLLNKEDFNDDTKDAGELGSGHTVTALYEIIPVGVENTYGGVDDLKYQNTKKIKNSATKDDVLSTELLTVKLRYKKPDETNSRKLEVPALANALNEEPSKDFKFIMAVAMFGQLLKDSDFKGEATYQKVIDFAKSGIDNDSNGYRREFIRLAEAVNQMEK
ncbi:MAG: von Willebrand factor type A domain-containing protein [Bacteroidales bacterium]|nr:von Willebrand factor type A domain-containing protein [Bacteroidales bacterium]